MLSAISLFIKVLFVCACVLLIAACNSKWSETQNGGIRIVTNEGGQTLGYSSESEVLYIVSNLYRI